VVSGTKPNPNIGFGFGLVLTLHTPKHDRPPKKKSIKKCQLKRVMFTKSYLSKLKADEVQHLKTISHKHLWKEVGIENKNITKLFISLIALKNCTYYRKVVVRCNAEHSW
jgi:hypothetical protein